MSDGDDSSWGSSSSEGSSETGTDFKYILAVELTGLSDRMVRGRMER